ncbi:hypothetical protein AVEN_262251-1 [Araneus ventricosus]|uniref:Uncharacterized protein n=1 Tax=Araneus ventricosus TaxID=182803 RepID=A0A4Y2QV02_ARAVE|nr:hypothetical protein AVEN_262251-1 [Araneus ventricosus]
MAFKNKRVARKYISKILIYLQSVDKQIKPCYLWDLFTADISEIHNYLKEIHSLGLTKSCLSTFSICDTIFVTDIARLQNYLDDFCLEDVEIVDVSASNSSPVLFRPDEKLAAIAPVLRFVQLLLDDIYKLPSTEQHYKFIDNVSDSSNTHLNVNLTTLFGFLLSYPVLYWYAPQTPDAEFPCLSMVPLDVHQVMTINKNECELFSFSVPQKVSKETEKTVNSWVSQMMTKCEISGFYEVQMTQKTVILPTVCM